MAVIILTVCLCLSIYLFFNHLLSDSPAHTLPFTHLDYHIPFIPSFFFIYITYIPFCVFSCYILKNKENFALAIYTFISYAILSSIIYVWYPTIYPREDFFLPENISSITQRLSNIVRYVDCSTTCFPSAHAGYCFIAAYIVLKEQKEKWLLIAPWGFLIIISTLTTKQHCLIDLIGGIVISYALLLFYRRFLF